MEPNRYLVDPKDRLDQCVAKGAALTWPIPLDEHLDRLRERVESVGERTNRRELAAALLFAAPKDADELAVLLKRYRTATVADLGLVVTGENIIELARHKPGPRKRSDHGA